MIEWLYDLDFHHWILFGLLLVVMEVFIGGSLLMWIGFAAIGLGLFVLLGPLVGVHLSWQWQLGLFTIGVLLAVYAWHRYARQPLPAAVQRPPVDALGKTVTLATDLRNGEGMVSIDGARWPVTGPEMGAGSRVRLTAIDDSTFTVEPVDQDQ